MNLILSLIIWGVAAVLPTILWIDMCIRVAKRGNK
jgi:hypothetical protein